ncbi:MAG: SpoIID/LytB domain-containing protein [candidate division Zixibacteria bacterium]|nr:SpoIID/LytB domain-containing protein [candidate division Zixibacteria bacterium]
MRPMDRVPVGSINWLIIYRMGLLVLALAGIVLCALRCGETPDFRERVFYSKIKQPAVTVKLLETKDTISVSSNGSFVTGCSPPKAERSICRASAEMLVRLSDDGLTLSQKTQGEMETDLDKVSFSCAEDGSYLYLNGRPYRGALEIARSKGHKRLLAVNVVHVEDYVKGVVAAEMGKLSLQELEALKAQAVAARTYALSRSGQYLDKGFDLDASVVDQAYGGVEAEDPLANLAVELTRGEVLTYNGELICAYYHANSGGKTECVESVWDKPKQDYLIPVDDGDFCSWSESYTWVESWTQEALERNLKKFLTPSVSKGESVNLVNLRIRKRSVSGRVEVLDVVTDWGTYSIRGDKIRWALKRGSDPNSILPSTWFDLEMERKSDGSMQRVIARGRGKGHGVGMCQTGAIGMARKGYSHKEILMCYYPGARIGERYGKSKPRV